MKSTEAALAREVVAYLQAEQWEVYQEVSFRGGIIDIVITRGPLLGVVECKQAFGVPVLDQAYRSLPFAHLVWVATWEASRQHGLLRSIASTAGIGHFTAAKNYPGNLRERLHPAFRRRLAVAPVLREALHDAQKAGNAEAGTNRGGVWTPWRETCLELRRVVAESPGITLRDAILAIKHHYSSTTSARASLKRWIGKGRVAGVRAEQDGRAIRLHPADAAQTKRVA